MLVSTNEVAERLKITNRAVQNKCKQAGLIKIGNQYQITKEIAEQWYKETENNEEAKTKRTKENSKTSQRSNFLTSFLIVFFSITTLAALILFFANIKQQLQETKTDLRLEKTEHKKEVQGLRNDLNKANEIISKQQLEIQRLKYKDSLLFRRP